MKSNWFLRESGLSLEVLILLICSVSVLVPGVLLFPVYAGVLPYYEGGLFGLLLFLIAMQTIALGRTPFGDAPRSWPLILAGTAIAAVGIVTCFIPGLLGNMPRLLLIACLGAGGVLLLLQLFLSKSRHRAWRTYGGIFRHLTASCALVYTLSIVIAVLLHRPGILAPPLTAVVALGFGLALLYLAWTIQRIRDTYPDAGASEGGVGSGILTSANAPVDTVVLMVLALFILLLGILLIPVNLGLLPFAGSAQLGLMMVIFAIQMVAFGGTPVGSFPRTRLMIVLGLVFAALGTASCITPELLVKPLTILIGLLNLAGGLVAIVKIVLPALMAYAPAQPVPRIQKQITMTTLIMNVLSVIFGSSMLIPGMIPGLILGAVLAANGCVLLYLVFLLLRVSQ